MSLQKNKSGLSNLDILFRHESGKMISTFARLFGIEYLELAERVVEESVFKAKSVIKYKRTPRDPAYWLWNIARVKGTEILRLENKLYDNCLKMNRVGVEEFKNLTDLKEEHLRENQIVMIFACCNPSIAPDSQVALILKLLCGLNVSDMSSGLSVKESVIVKDLQKGRQVLKGLEIYFQPPIEGDLSENLESALQVLYLIYKKGYDTYFENRDIGSYFCKCAIELVTLFTEYPLTNVPKTQALLSMMSLDYSRFHSRFDEEGRELPLQDQDRTAWDRRMISKGLSYLHMAASSDEVTEYHLRAGILACHAIAESYEATDWRKILALYDNYLMLSSSPDLILERATVLSKIYGVKAGIDEINRIRKIEGLTFNDLLYLELGDLYMHLNQFEDALENYKTAIKYSRDVRHQLKYEEKIEFCQKRIEMSQRYSLEKSF